jgi:hypothetical protein
MQTSFWTSGCESWRKDDYSERELVKMHNFCAKFGASIRPEAFAKTGACATLCSKGGVLLRIRKMIAMRAATAAWEGQTERGNYGGFH